MTDQDQIARIEAKLLNPPEFIHADACPLSDEIRNEGEDCICDKLADSERAERSYRRRFDK